MGLIARELEGRGVSTLCLSSAWSITRSVHPPRALFLDFPLGHTAGKPGDQPLQRQIMIDALNAFATIKTPGRIHTLPYRWSDDPSWKDIAMRRRRKGGQPADDRAQRSATPQYQAAADQAAAQERLAAEGGCSDCVFPAASG